MEAFFLFASLLFLSPSYANRVIIFWERASHLVVHLCCIFCDVLCCPSGPEVIKLFLCSAQLKMKFQLLIDFKIVKIGGKIQVQN